TRQLGALQRFVVAAIVEVDEAVQVVGRDGLEPAAALEVGEGRRQVLAIELRLALLEVALVAALPRVLDGAAVQLAEDTPEGVVELRIAVGAHLLGARELAMGVLPLLEGEVAAAERVVIEAGGEVAEAAHL